MDITAISEEDFNVWVDFQEDAQVLLRYVSLEELLAINAKASTHSLKPAVASAAGTDRGEGIREISAEVAPEDANRLLGRAAVRGWRGLKKDGKEFPYSADNCDLLMRRWTEFAVFVGEVCLELREINRRKVKESKKKLKLTSGSEQISPESAALPARR
jgi:hypothetical protein